MSNTDGEITDGERRKRMNTENDSEEDNAFLKSKKLSRTLMKLKQKNEDKLERVLEILQQLTQDVNQIKLKQIRSNTELIELKVRNENLRMENKNTKKENSKIVKEIQEINTRVEQLEKEKRTNNIVIQDLMLKENNTQKLKEDTEKFLNEKRDMNIRVERKTVKDLWRKLRDCHRDALRRQKKFKSGDKAKKVKVWTYKKHMEFLVPYMANRNTWNTSGNVESSQQDEIENLTDNDTLHSPSGEIPADEQNEDASEEVDAENVQESSQDTTVQVSARATLKTSKKESKWKH
ncbi:hypothetical protein FQA39_LY07207 [Lamprigera yunnana]|nr:hypothetical protein FQA39_LY07207 [Lamprigera yunnana]